MPAHLLDAQEKYDDAFCCDVCGAPEYTCEQLAWLLLPAQASRISRQYASLAQLVASVQHDAAQLAHEPRSEKLVEQLDAGGGGLTEDPVVWNPNTAEMHASISVQPRFVQFADCPMASSL